jgi:hypothetical protein
MPPVLSRVVRVDAVVVQDLVKTYGETRALDGVSLTVGFSMPAVRRYRRIS